MVLFDVSLRPILNFVQSRTGSFATIQLYRKCADAMFKCMIVTHKLDSWLLTVAGWLL